MSYRVIMDGNDILNYRDKAFALLSPTLNVELNTAGSFEFTMPPGHALYHDVRPLKSTVEVYEDDVLLWFGRPVETKVDFYNQREVYCEGALSFFNDSVQRPREYDGELLHAFFRDVISSHNSQVDPSRQFEVGRITMPNRGIYRKLNYESTFDTLKRYCLGAEGGYLFVRRENGANFIDWLADMPLSCNQPVEFGLNLLDMTSGFNGASIATCVLPLGDTDAESGEALTVAGVNGGSDIIVSDAVSEYGRITKAVTFSGVKSTAELYAEGMAYLRETQFNDVTIDCSAAELHLQNGNYELFQVGQMIRCRSVPHLVDRDLPLVKLSLRLDTAAKKITLGTVARQSLTQIYKDVQDTADTEIPENPATQQEIEEVKQGIEETMGEIEKLQEDVAVLQSATDGWVHQVNGETLASATINFITLS